MELKNYYIGGTVVALILAVLTFVISAIGSCSNENNKIDKAEELKDNSVVIRYFTDEDYNTSSIKYIRVIDIESIHISVTPPQGKILSGFYDGLEGNAKLYVTGDGYLLEKPSKDILLYPVFRDSLNGGL